MAAGRRAPEDGYDFGAKRQYRRDIYAQFKRSCDGHLADKRLAMLPSSEGAEIEVALKAGFKQHNIWIIDENPAIVATLKRAYPHVNTCGVTAERAAKRIAGAGGVHYANLDLCGPIGAPLFRTLDAWRDARALVEGGQIAVTVLRGREKGIEPVPIRHVTVNKMSDAVVDPPDSARDAHRLACIALRLSGLPLNMVEAGVTWREWASAPYSTYLVRSGSYRSTAGHQTMLWGIWKLHDKGCLCDECVMAFRVVMLRDASAASPLKALQAISMKLATLRTCGWSEEAIASAQACHMGMRHDSGALNASQEMDIRVGWA